VSGHGGARWKEPLETQKDALLSSATSPAA
jgi:hypothetical protein